MVTQHSSARRHGRLIDGRAHAQRILKEVHAAVDSLAKNGHVPGLAVIFVGVNPASQIYVAAKLRRAKEVGIRTFEYCIDEIDEHGLLMLVKQLNLDPNVHGILVQLPLPRHVDSRKILATVSPDKDVDGFHPVNLGRLFANMPGVVPCTPRGCLELIKNEWPELEGRDAVVIGASNIVGRPMAALLLNAGCTVSIGHKASRDLPALTRLADIVVIAAGAPGLVRGDWIKPGAVVIDVGITRVPHPELGSRIVGDAEHDEVRAVAGAITPVPGGVGPMTVAFLMVNTLDLFRSRLGQQRELAGT